MTTFSGFKANVSRDLRDTGNLTFGTDVVGDLINAALAEVGRLAPQRFQEDIVPVADVLTYQLRQVGSTKALTTPFGVASTNLLTSTAHGLLSGQALQFQSLTGGAGLAVGTVYYVIATGLATNAFEVSATLGGGAVDFTTDIAAGTFHRVGAVTADPVPEIELKRVEIWDGSTTPPQFLRLLRPLAWEYYNTSSVGWEVWDGVLALTNRQEQAIDATKDIIRVWGYGPYLPLVNDADVVGVSNEIEWAMRAYCRVEALQRLAIERDLFAQWQTHSGNTDVSPASLLSALSLAENDWKSRARGLLVLRERP